MYKKRIFTSRCPSQSLSITDLVSTIRCWVKVQESYDCFFLLSDLFIVDSHFSQPDQVQNKILNSMADLLAIGISPQNTTFILQSIIPEHAQLSLLLEPYFN